MAIDLNGRDLVKLINDIVDQRLAQSLGGSPGVYTNATITIRPDGRISFASGGGEVGLNVDGGNGTVTFAVPYQMRFGTAVAVTSGGAATVSYAPPPGTSFGTITYPFTAAKGGAIRLALTGAGTADFAAVTLVRQPPVSAGTA